MYVQDMNNDNIPDVVALAPHHAGFNAVTPVIGDQRSKIRVFDGQDGSIIATFNIPNNGTQAYSQVALGDVDKDGNGDIFIVGVNRRVYRFEMGTSTPVWTSSAASANLVLDKQQSPQLADFNADGTPEIYVGNAIFDAISGTNLVRVDGSKNSGRNSGTQADAWPIAFDVDGDGDLELLAGSSIFDVNLVAGTLTEKSFVDPADFTFTAAAATTTQIGDGFTSIADLDGNGLVDVVVVRGQYLFAWEPSNASVGNNRGTVRIQPVAIAGGNRGGRACIGDFTGDNTREIGVVGKNVFKLYDYNASTNSVSVLFSKSIDDRSGRTGCTLFDFEGDGNAEIVYSDEENLMIWDAAGNTLASIQSQSGTRTDYPLVVDIDADGQAEIVVTAQDINGPSNGEPGYVAVYESVQKPWVSARKNWNQHGFFNTNVNSDGSIPQQQQSHLILPDPNSALNSFLSQLSTLSVNGVPVEPAPDLTVSIQNVVNDIDFSNCPGSISVVLEVCNNGSKVVNLSFPISFYHNDPRTLANTPRFLGVELITGASVPINGCISLPAVDIPLLDLSGSNGANDGDVFFVVNDSSRGYAVGDALTAPISMPNYPLLECDYSNNFRGPIVIEDCDFGTLPIELILFEAALKMNRIHLNWTTETEENNSHFEIQRSSDGAYFQTIGQISGHGTTISSHYYTYIDTDPLVGYNYYRLKQFDFDGDYTYSKIIVKKLAGHLNTPLIYPNPVDKLLSIELRDLDTKYLHIALVNKIGQVVYQKQYNTPNDRINIPVHELPKGTYQVVFNKDGETTSYPIVVY
jgi:hypothetical protein